MNVDRSSNNNSAQSSQVNQDLVYLRYCKSKLSFQTTYTAHLQICQLTTEKNPNIKEEKRKKKSKFYTKSKTYTGSS